MKISTREQRFVTLKSILMGPTAFDLLNFMQENNAFPHESRDVSVSMKLIDGGTVEGWDQIRNFSCVAEAWEDQKIRTLLRCGAYREKRYISHLTVRACNDLGSLLDMMRYDSCWPATKEDVAKLVRLHEREASEEDRIVKFIRASRGGAPATEGRWNSFGCKVLDERRPNAEPYQVAS